MGNSGQGHPLSTAGGAEGGRGAPEAGDSLPGAGALGWAASKLVLSLLGRFGVSRGL